MRNAKLAGAKESLKRIAAKKLQTGSANVGSAKKRKKTSEKKTEKRQQSATVATYTNRPDPNRTWGPLALADHTKKKKIP